MRKSLFLLFAIVSVAGMIAFSGCDTDVKTYTVTFDANGGEGTMDTQLFTEDYEKALSANKFTREGYSFAGWNTMRDGTGTAYTDQQKIKVVADMTLYAQWNDTSVTTYTVTFDANGGIGEMAPQIFTIGTAQALTANAFTKENNWFAGWNTASDGQGTAYTDSQEITATENMTLYAQWKLSTGENNGHIWVDLDLPSGNMWATCNVGADAPEAAGNYYAWAETATKQTYTTENYPYIRLVVEGEDTLQKLTKYCSHGHFGYEGFSDELESLLAEDDAAAVNWGGQWKTPSEEDYQELIRNCTITTDTINNVVGLTFKGTNGNSIFMPAVRYYSDEGLVENVCGRYWTSTLATDISYTSPTCAMNCTFYLEYEYAEVYPWVRDCGLPVRAICTLSK